MHLVPLLTDTGFSLEFATRILMVLMICGAFGIPLEYSQTWLQEYGGFY